MAGRGEGAWLREQRSPAPPTAGGRSWPLPGYHASRRWCPLWVLGPLWPLVPSLEEKEGRESCLCARSGSPVSPRQPWEGRGRFLPAQVPGDVPRVFGFCREFLVFLLGFLLIYLFLYNPSCRLTGFLEQAFGTVAASVSELAQSVPKGGPQRAPPGHRVGLREQGCVVAPCSDLPLSFTREHFLGSHQEQQGITAPVPCAGCPEHCSSGPPSARLAPASWQAGLSPCSAAEPCTLTRLLFSQTTRDLLKCSAPQSSEHCPQRCPTPRQTLRGTVPPSPSAVREGRPPATARGQRWCSRLSSWWT